MTRVAIAGGGPGGLALAAVLSQRGCDFALYERRSVIEPVGSGISLSPPPLILLQRLGLDLDELGVPSDFEFARHDGRRRTGRIASPEIERIFGAMAWSLLRPALHAALLRRLPADGLHAGSDLTGFDEVEGAVRLRFADGSEAEADVLVGADGLHSAVRRTLFGDEPVRSHRLVCHQGYAAWRGLPDREGQILHDTERQFGHSPLRVDGVLGRQWWYIERGEPGEPLVPGTRERIATELRVGGWRRELSDLVLATDEKTLLRRDIADRPPLPRWSRGRATLLGDAAHPTSPYAGYGAGMAIEDAWVLGNLLGGRDLRDTRALEAVFADYEAQRRVKSAQVSQLAWRLGRIFHSPHAWVRALRDALLDRTALGGYAIRRGYLASLELEMKRI